MVKIKKSQMRIQQMAFMIVAVFFFFILVSLFLLQIFVSEINYSVQEREREQALNFLDSLSELPEFSCSENNFFCLDEDKLLVLKNSEINNLYSDFWPVSSIKVYKIKGESKIVECPSQNCNFYNIFEDKNQKQKMEISSYVLICKKILDNSGNVNDLCELGKLLVGMKIRD
ncbi:MAG: hypothetical protein QXG18_00900 [Candidatus Pacearchaeota archaeon]